MVSNDEIYLEYYFYKEEMKQTIGVNVTSFFSSF